MSSHISNVLSLNVTSGSETVLRVSDQVLYQVYIPDASTTLTSLTWYGSPDGLTWYLAAEIGTNGVQTVAHGCTYAVPVVASIAMRFLRATGNVSATIIATIKT